MKPGPSTLTKSYSARSDQRCVQRPLGAGAERVAPAEAVGARAGIAEAAVDAHVGLGMHPGAAALRVEERAAVGAERPADARRQRAERIDVGMAVGADIEAGKSKTGVGAVGVGPARVRLESQKRAAEQPVVPDLAAGEHAGRAHGVAEERGSVRIVDVGEPQHAAAVGADVEAAPVEERRHVRLARRHGVRTRTSGDAANDRQHGDKGQACAPHG